MINLGISKSHVSLADENDYDSICYIRDMKNIILLGPPGAEGYTS